MIDKLNNHTYKSFLNYTNPDKFLFKQKNVFFGYNGKGKTSLTNGIEKEIKKDKTVSDANIRIFSNRFMSLKLINDATSRIKGIKAVFGNKNVKNDEKIDELKSMLEETKSLETTINNLKTNIDGTIRTVEDNLRGKIKIRHQSIDSFEDVDKLIEVFNNNYKKALSITTDDKLDNFNGNYDFEKTKQEINNLPILDLSFDKEEIRESISILGKEYSLEKIPSIELLDWLKKGIDLNKNEKHCLFCGSPIQDINKIEEKYNEYLSNEKQRDIKKVSITIQNLANAKKSLDLFIEKIESYKLLKIDISEKIKIILEKKKELEDFIGLLELKQSNFETKIDLSFEITFIDGTLEKQLNEIRQEKNNSLNSILKEESKANDLIKGLIGKTIINHKGLKKDIKDYKENISNLTATNEKNGRIKQEIKKLQNSFSVYDSFATYINLILLDLDIKFKLEIIENDYRILPINNELEIKIGDISEGEKNLLSFLFFYYELFENLDSMTFKNDIQYIIIDDPISSLDENNKSYLETLLKDLINASGFQLFILTHDWTVFCDILYGKNKVWADDSLIRAFEIKKDNNSHNYLAFAKPTISPYEHDFFELLDVNESKKADDLDDGDIYHLPNCMRRVLESFLSFKISNCSPTDNNFEQIKDALYHGKECSHKNESSLHAALTLINANSHLPARNSTDVYNVLKYLINIISSADPVHFNMIKSKKSSYNTIS